jgi:hypothetical protein
MFRSKTESASRAVSATVLLASLLAGCSDLYFDRRETIAFDGGDSIAANAAEQTIDPWPRHSNNNRLTFNGQRMQHAVECYRINKVAPPTDLDASVDAAAIVPPAPPATCDSTLSAINGANASQWSNNGSTNSVGGALSTALGGGGSQSK